MEPAHNISRATMNQRGNNINESISKLSIDSGETYVTGKVIDKGSFGVVFQATVSSTGETVAIKKVFQDSRYKNRELELMQELNHPNIISLRHSYYTSEGTKTFLNLVMDFVPETLYKVVRQYARIRQPVPPILVKYYSFQMLRGLGYLHALGITHRDVKPQNFLVDTNSHTLRVCDFGSAKRLIRGEPSVAYISSRFYRAPELIFGCTDYTSAIDVWGAGCVIAEIMLGQPVFPGDSSMDQLVEIIKVLGTPTRAQILDMNPQYQESRIPQIKYMGFSKIFRKNVSQEAIDLVTVLLTYSPANRPTAMQALAHPFFDELFDRNACLPNGRPCRGLIHFSEDELRRAPDSLRAKLIS